MLNGCKDFLHKLLVFGDPNNCHRSYVNSFVRLVILGIVPCLLLLGIILGCRYLSIHFPLVLNIFGIAFIGLVLSATVGGLIVLILWEIADD